MLYVVRTGELTLAESVTKSLILLNPVANIVKLRQLDVSLAATAAQEEILFQLYRVETIGAPAGTAAAIQPGEEWAPATATTALTALTAEPTAVKIIADYLVQPLGGIISIPFPFGAEIAAKAAGARLGLQYKSKTSKPVAACNLWFEE